MLEIISKIKNAEPSKEILKFCFHKNQTVPQKHFTLTSTYHAPEPQGQGYICHFSHESLAPTTFN